MENNFKKMNPFFSIVLSIYNVEKFLERCINSILNQKFQDFELILVDDGSNDNSVNICDDYQKKDYRIKVIHKVNAGLGMARNSGLDIATGKYIFFIDSDDYVSSNLLEDMFNEIKLNRSDIIFYGHKRILSNGTELSEMIPITEKKYYDNKEEISDILLADFLGKDPNTGIIRNLRISAWNCCINIDILKVNKVKFVSEREYISEDVIFYLDLFKNLNNVSIIDKAYYYYCQNSGSLTFSYKPDRFIKLKQFYLVALDRAQKLGYSYNVQQRLSHYFISNIIGCLKMEVASFRKIGLRNTYDNIKSIIGDEELLNIIKEYPKKHFCFSWKSICTCIERKHTFLLILILLVQFLKKGI